MDKVDWSKLATIHQKLQQQAHNQLFVSATSTP